MGDEEKDPQGEEQEETTDPPPNTDPGTVLDPGKSGEGEGGH